MDTIKFKNLQIEVPANGYSFKDLGHVTSVPHAAYYIKTHILTCRENHPIANKLIENNINTIKTINTGFITGENKRMVGIFTGEGLTNKMWIYYRHFRCNADNIGVQAHEETHALDYMNRLDVLQERLNNMEINIDLMEIKSNDNPNELSEMVAGIGELYALHINGYTHKDMYMFNKYRLDLERISLIDIWNNAIPK